MCAGEVLVLLSLLLASATEGVEMFVRLGGCVSFWLLIGCGLGPEGIRSGVRRSAALQGSRRPRDRERQSPGHGSGGAEPVGQPQDRSRG